MASRQSANFEDFPWFWIIAGPNGSGKSTWADSKDCQDIIGQIPILKDIPIRHEDTLFFSPSGVIPAKAGIHRKIVLFQIVGMDPRLRGDDTEWLQESPFFLELVFSEQPPSRG